MMRTQRFGRKSSIVAWNIDKRTWIKNGIIYVQRIKRAGMSKVLGGAVDGRIETRRKGGLGRRKQKNSSRHLPGHHPTDPL